MKKKKLLIPLGKDTPQRRRIFERDNRTCKYCGYILTIETMTLDHKVPKSKGGLNNDNNLVSCCYQCNLYKANMSVETFTKMLSKGRYKK